MAERRTRITLSIPWDDEDCDHPASWGYDVLLHLSDSREVLVVDFQEIDEHGNLIPDEG